MRNADLAIDEDDASDLLKEIEKQIKKRAWGEVIRLDVEAEMDKRLLKELKKQLNVNSDYVYSVNGPLDLTFLGKVRGLDGFDHLKNKKYIPQPVKGLISMRISSTRSRRRISCYIIRMMSLHRSLSSSNRRQLIRMYLQSSRRCTVSVAILQSLQHLHLQRKMASR